MFAFMNKNKSCHNFFLSVGKLFPANLVVVFMAVVLVFEGYLFLKVSKIEKRLETAGIKEEKESALSINNLKNYAKELGLDTKEFTRCLDGNQKKEAVEKDTKYGSTLGVQGTPGFFINGRFLAGAFPFEFFKEIIDKELDGSGSENCADYSESIQQYCSDPNNKSFDPVAKKVSPGKSPTKGNEKANITIIEFSDFECPYCTRAYQTVNQVLSEYKDKIRLHYMHFPLSQIHPNAQKAAEASLCADDQGKFWEYHDKLFEKSQEAQQ